MSNSNPWGASAPSNNDNRKQASDSSPSKQSPSKGGAPVFYRGSDKNNDDRDTRISSKSILLSKTKIKLAKILSIKIKDNEKRKLWYA